MGSKAVPQRVHADPLGQSYRPGRRTAGCLKHLHIDRLVAPSGKQPIPRARQPPIGTPDTKQLRRPHHGAILGALAVTDLNHHALAVDVGDLQSHRLRTTQSCGTGVRQRRTRL
jgi:hypothetical protein